MKPMLATLATVLALGIPAHRAFAALDGLADGAPRVVFTPAFLLDVARQDARAASVLLGVQQVSSDPQWAGRMTNFTVLGVTYEDVADAILNGTPETRRRPNGRHARDETSLAVKADGTAELTIEQFDGPVNMPDLSRKAGTVRVFLERASGGTYVGRTFQLLK